MKKVIYTILGISGFAWLISNGNAQTVQQKPTTDAKITVCKVKSPTFVKNKFATDKTSIVASKEGKLQNMVEIP